MTHQESLLLNVGDVVEAGYHSGWVKVEIVGILDFLLNRGFHVRRVGKDRRGANFPTLYRDYKSLRRVKPTPTGNVMADWLEENGFPEAAQALREAFPLLGD